MMYENCENCFNCLNKFCFLDMKCVSFLVVVGNKKLKEINYFFKGIFMIILLFLNVYNLGYMILNFC